ncbi:MAG: hypothetical protein JW829_19925 [Pirellulales bacterium]|nr:hypothetical protein [Pirellulales bacterium]
MPGPILSRTTIARHLIAVFFTLPLAGCSLSGPSVPTRYEPQKAAEVAIETYDTNKDGKLSETELDRCLSLKSVLSRIDANRDRAITADEIARRFEALAGQSTFVAVTISVTKGGRPVSGATVMLRPEPFMGEGYQAFSGTTDEGGMASVVGEKSVTPGVATGFYQVQITESAGGGKVELGCEVSDDSNNRLAFSL